MCINKYVAEDYYLIINTPANYCAFANRPRSGSSMAWPFVCSLQLRALKKETKLGPK